MTEDSSTKSKRIAKNTLLLFFRMGITMCIALLTSRLIFHALGVTDFGIYNVVGGIVGMLGFMMNSLGGSSARFITYAIGKGEHEKIAHLFSCIFSIHLIIAIVIVILAETVGLWFLLHKIVLPENRRFAALVVYQTSIIATFLSFITVPYDAMIIAHEHMKAFAWISIAEILIRLGLVSLLFIIPFDHLILYSVFVLLLQQAIRYIYIRYCHKNFPESHVHWIWDKKISKEVFSYTGWVLNGNIAVMGYNQGITILLNLFFGPIVNAARGIASQVQTNVYLFFNNFLMASHPQITKSYASGDLSYMHKLLLSSSKLAYFLGWLVVLPIYHSTPYILYLWLGKVPDYTVNFVRLMLIYALSFTLKDPLLTAIHATGKIKRFQLIEGNMLLTIVPIAYIGLKWFSFSPEDVLLVLVIVEYITQAVRVMIVLPSINLEYIEYIKKVIVPVIAVSIITFFSRYLLPSICIKIPILSFIISSIIIILCSAILIYAIGLNKGEKYFIKTKVIKLCQRFQ